MSVKLIAGLVVLGFLALGGLASGDAGGIVFGAACAAGGVALFYYRRPATVTVGLARVARGTEIAVSGGRDADRAAEIVKTVAGAPPAPDRPERPEVPRSLWRPPSG